MIKLKDHFQRKVLDNSDPVLCLPINSPPIISAEILELAGNAARDNKKARIAPRHILLAVANDEELNQVCLKHICHHVDLPNTTACGPGWLQIIPAIVPCHIYTKKFRSYKRRTKSAVISFRVKLKCLWNRSCYIFWVWPDHLFLFKSASSCDAREGEVHTCYSSVSSPKFC